MYEEFSDLFSSDMAKLTYEAANECTSANLDLLETFQGIFHTKTIYTSHRLFSGEKKNETFEISIQF